MIANVTITPNTNTSILNDMTTSSDSGKKEKSTLFSIINHNRRITLFICRNITKLRRIEIIN